MSTAARPRRARAPRILSEKSIGISDKRPPVLPVPTEHQEQAEVVTWAELNRTRWPELALLFAVPNAGGFQGGFKSNVVRVMRLRAQGVKAGVPDLCLPVPRQGKHGLYIEMKRLRGGTVSAEQRAWHIALRDVGHRVEVCRGASAAIEVLTDYLTRAA
jgi:hypothetical protein